MTTQQIVVTALVDAPLATAWQAYTAPDHVMQWNFASDDWHCPAARADLRAGGTFAFRMQAKDGSFGFDFEGTYTQIIVQERIDYTFGDRRASVVFLPQGDKVRVTVSFDPETDNPREMQRSGWQAILDSYAGHAGRL